MERQLFLFCKFLFNEKRWRIEFNIKKDAIGPYLSVQWGLSEILSYILWIYTECNRFWVAKSYFPIRWTVPEQLQGVETIVQWHVRVTLNKHCSFSTPFSLSWYLTFTASIILNSDQEETKTKLLKPWNFFLQY